MLKKIKKDELIIIKNLLKKDIFFLLNYYKEKKDELLSLQNILVLLNTQEIYVCWILMKKIEQIDIINLLPFYLKDSVIEKINNNKEMLVSLGGIF